MSDWLGSTPATLGWITLGTALMYLSALAAIRLAGRRTVARMSAFDFVVTVAIGSVVANVSVSREQSYVDGLTAIVTLLVLQMAVGALRQRSDAFRRLVDFRPVVLYERSGLDLPRTPLGAQPTKEEVESELRQRGITDWGTVDRIILEPDGRVSVISHPSLSGRS